MDSIILAPILGLLVGIVAAFFGIGGGVLFVPILILIFNLPVKSAVGTSLLAIFITSMSSMIAYTRQKRIVFRVGLIMESASIPGAILGAYFTTLLPGEYLRKAFSIFLIFVAFNIMRKKAHSKSIEDKPSVDYNRKNIAQLLLFSFCAGFLSATLGIGGGVLNVPIMLLVLHFPIHYAVATSCFVIVVTSLTGVSQHLRYSHVEVFYGLSLGFGAVIGAQIGAQVSRKTAPSTLKKLFAVLLVVTAIRLMIK